MSDLIISSLGVFALGLTTTLHPCPLTTNIAAISVITGTSSQRKKYNWTITGFVLGYLLSFVVLALIISNSLVAIPAASVFLQRVVTSFFGPLLIVVGMVLTKMINLNKFYKSISLDKNYWLTSGSFVSSMVLGGILALTFCPATASIFFGVMIPLSVKHEQTIFFPLLFAIGALVPVIGVSILLRRGLAVVVKKRWTTLLPIIAGWILIFIGIYISLEQLYF
jgi:cytochrome c-type biogenesis protein